MRESRNKHKHKRGLRENCDSRLGITDLLALLLQFSIDIIEWAVMPRGLRREATVKE
jgi:hypothetical protein